MQTRRWVRLTCDRWATHKKGDIFQPITNGQANSLVRFGRAEYVDGPACAPEAACVVPQEETATIKTPKPRRRKRGGLA